MTTKGGAAGSEGWAVYQEFMTECETATSMTEILPLLPQWRHERYQASDETAREETLERLCKETRDDYTDFSFVSEETSTAKTILHLKAKWDDFSMKGRVTLVREDGDLKIEEWFWATGE